VHGTEYPIQLLTDMMTGRDTLLFPSETAVASWQNLLQAAAHSRLELLPLEMLGRWGRTSHQWHFHCHGFSRAQMTAMACLDVGSEL